MNTKLMKLIEKTEELNDNLEYNVATINGVSNLSRSDRDVIIMIAKEIISIGYTNMMIAPNIEKVFTKAGIKINNGGGFF